MYIILPKITCPKGRGARLSGRHPGRRRAKPHGSRGGEEQKKKNSSFIPELRLLSPTWPQRAQAKIKKAAGQKLILSHRVQTTPQGAPLKLQHNTKRGEKSSFLLCHITLLILDIPLEQSFSSSVLCHLGMGNLCLLGLSRALQGVPHTPGLYPLDAYSTRPLVVTFQNVSRSCSQGGAVLSCSVVPDSLQPHGLQPARLLCPWVVPSRFGTRIWVSWKTIFSRMGGRGGDGFGIIQVITFIVHFISIIITSAQSQIIRH